LSGLREELMNPTGRILSGNALLRFSGMTSGVNQRRVFILKNDSVAFY
jgi:hypothetical protein